MVTILLLLSCTTLAQSVSKLILVDTNSSEYKRSLGQSKLFELDDLLQVSEGKYYRYSSGNKIVCLKKIGNYYEGTIIYHVEWKKNNRTENQTLWKKEAIDYPRSKYLFDLLEESRIDTFRNGDSIKSKYIVLHCPSKNYVIATTGSYVVKSYECPNRSESFFELDKANELSQKISDTLKLRKGFEEYLGELPNKGSYHYGIYSTVSARPYNPFTYFGSTRMPFGFGVTILPKYLGIENNKFNFRVYAATDFKGSSDISLQYNTNPYLIKRGDSLGDYFGIKYRRRQLRINEDPFVQNFKMRYGIYGERVWGGVGLDARFGQDRRQGPIVYLGKYFGKDLKRFYAFAQASVFDKQMDYEFALGKTIGMPRRFRRKYFRSIGLELTYEKFMSYQDVYFMARFYF